MEAEHRKNIIEILAAGALLAVSLIIEKTFPLKGWHLLAVYLVPYLVAGRHTLSEALESIIHLEPLDEDFLMSAATLGALGIGFLPGGEYQFAEAVFVMIFFRLGEFFEDISEDGSRKSISHLMELRPDVAEVQRDGEVVTVPAAEVVPGDIVVVRPGGRIPLDGIVYEGTSGIDTSALTGESMPRSVASGDEVVSGCVNGSGLLKVKVSRPLAESTATRILELVENSAASKASPERFITRFAKVYTPVVVAVALILAVLPPLLGAGSFATWLYRGLTFLIVSCPCALVISVPLAFFCGIGGLSRKGVLAKGGHSLEVLSKADTFVFDKTGTLTEGVFTVVAVHPEIIDQKELLHLAAHVEHYSSHPVAAAIRLAWEEDADGCEVSDVSEIPGKGVVAVVNGRRVAVGNTALMEDQGAVWHGCEHPGTIVHVCLDGQYVGHIVISDRIKQDAAEAVSQLGRRGVGLTVMLTGDNEGMASSVAGRLGIGSWHSGLLPQDKVSEIKKLKEAGHTPVFVGDGVNDAPVLTEAALGVAMGALGSDAAIEAADLVVMDDRLSKLPVALSSARKTVRIARQNTVFAIGVKMAVLVLSAFGITGMGLAVFADVGVMVLAVLNSVRAGSPAK